MAAPKVGEIYDGHRFKGGDPNDEKSWEPADAAGAAIAPQKSGYVPPLSPEQQAENVQAGQRAAFRDQPKMDQFLAGVGSFAYRFPGMAKLSQLAGQGSGDAKAELKVYDDASKGAGVEDLGELAPDIAMTLAGGGAATKGLKLGNLAISATKKALLTGGAQGLASAGIHQLQNVGSGAGFKPGQAATEVALSALLAGGGAKLAEKLKKVAPQVLRSATKPVLNSMDVPNPPDFEVALEKNLVPYMGGLEGAEKRATKEVGRLGQLRDLAAAGATNPVPARQVMGPGSGSAVEAAGDALAKEFNSTKGKMSKEVLDEAQQALSHWDKQLGFRPTADNLGKMSVEDALHARQMIDREVTFRESNKTLTDGFNKASELLRTKLNDVIRKESPRTAELTDEMAKVVPFAKALGRRNLQAGNNYKVGLLDLSSLASGGALGMAASNPSIAVPALAMSALAGRKLTSTPGGAAMMYDAGRSLADASATRNTLAQLARSTYHKGKR